MRNAWSAGNNVKYRKTSIQSLSTIGDRSFREVVGDWIVACSITARNPSLRSFTASIKVELELAAK